MSFHASLSKIKEKSLDNFLLYNKNNWFYYDDDLTVILSPSLNVLLYGSLFVLCNSPSLSSSPSLSPSITSIIPESTISTTFSVAEPSCPIKALSKCCPLIIILEPPDKRYSLDSMSENVLLSKILSWLLAALIPSSELDMTLL